MKKISRIISILCCIAVLTSNFVNAAELASVMNAYTCSDSVVLFVKNQGNDIEQIYLGSDEAQEFTTEDVGPVRTVVVLDNSLSINKKYRETIKTFLTDLVAARNNGDTFTIATFAQNITYLVEESSDYLNIKSQIDNLQFINQDSYFTNIMYTVMNDISKYEDIKYTRVIVIADGVDDEDLGYTDEELNRKIQAVKVPIYTIGCRGKEENLKKMFALSRSSNAKSYLFDDASSTEILQDIAQDTDVVKVHIKPQEKSCDGTTKAVRVSYGEGYCTTELVMPFKAVPEEIMTEPETVTEPETTAEPETIETEPPETEPPETEPIQQGKGFPIGLTAVIVLIVAAVGAGAAVFLVKKRKPQQEQNHVDLSHIGHSSSTAMAGGSQNGGTEMLGGGSRNDEWEKTDMIGGSRSVKLVLQDMDDASKTFEYPLRDRLLIGRDSSRCQIVIGYSRFISSVHCEVILKGNSLYVRDGGKDVIASTNGTFVNGQKAAPELPLPSGAVLKLGQVRFKVIY